MPELPIAPELLRAAAAAHQPNRERMLARIEFAMANSAVASPRRAPRVRPGLAMPGWLRVAGAAAVLTATLGVGTIAVGWGGGPGPTPAPPAATTPEKTPGRLAASGVLNSNSNDGWTQGEVTVDVRETLTAFSLEVRVPADEGVVFQEKENTPWDTLPPENKDDLRLTVGEGTKWLTFRWELRKGRELLPNAWIFATQYHHDPQHVAERATFRIEGETLAGHPVSDKGSFG